MCECDSDSDSDVHDAQRFLDTKDCFVAACQIIVRPIMRPKRLSSTRLSVGLGAKAAVYTRLAPGAVSPCEQGNT